MSSDPPLITAKGINVEVTFDGRIVTIARRTALRTKERRIPVSSITAVEWKPLRLGRGSIGFTIPGDEDDVEASFVKKSLDEFTALRDAVEAAIG